MTQSAAFKEPKRAFDLDIAMPISPQPIYASDITSLSTPGSPVTVATAKATNLERPLAHGWIDEAVIQPGFEVFAASYDSHAAYSINTTAEAGFFFGLNLGDVDSADVPKQGLHLPSGTFGTMSLDEPLAIRLHRGERKHQRRCGITLRPEWIASGMFERFEDSGIIARTVTRRGISEASAASTGLLSAAARLFAAFESGGPLATLRREAAALGFLAEAFTGADESRQNRPAARIEVARIRRVKDMLDSLAPDVEISLVALAAAHGMSVRSLCRHFRMTFGTTVFAYVAQRRMDRARTALERDGFTVDQAAYIAGFAHSSNFSSAFQRRYGYRPGKGSSWRRSE